MNDIKLRFFLMAVLLLAAILSAINDYFYVTWLLVVAIGFELLFTVKAVKQSRQVFEMIRSLRYFKETGKTQKHLIQDSSQISELILEINYLIDVYDALKVEKKLESERSKQLLSNLSHDIRTPLTSIIGYVDALNDGIVTEEEELKEFIGILSMKSKNLKHLTDQIFNVARIDAEDVLMNFEYLELNELLTNTVIEFIPEFEKNQIKLINEIKDVKYLVYADRIALSRVFQNILKNAIQHGKDGKEIGVRTRILNEHYRVIIWDRGKGIPKSKQKHIFERLFKVDDSRKFGASNSGLGMAIAKKIIDKHDGNIALRSQENKLTEFFIELPTLKELNL